MLSRRVQLIWRDTHAPRLLPAPPPVEWDAVPLNEIVVIFDADQVAKAEFYKRLLPFMDAGDNVALVLTPQTYFNIPVMSDIFNHNNPHFW